MFKSVLGFNSRFTQGVVGEANLLAAASSTGAAKENVFITGNKTEAKKNIGITKGNGTAGAKVVTVDGSEGKAKLHEVVKVMTGVDLGTLGL
jgi:hypothetical protein